MVAHVREKGPRDADVARVGAVDRGHPGLGELAVGDDKVVGGDYSKRARLAKVAVDGPVARGMAKSPSK